MSVAQALHCRAARVVDAAWVFSSLDGTLLDGANLEKASKRALKVANLPQHFSPHCLRHTYASLLLQDGVSPAYVQEQLGHSSIELTVDTYGRWLRKEAPGAGDRLDEAPAAEKALGANARHTKLLTKLVDRGGIEPPTS